MSPATTKYVSLYRTLQVSTIIGMIVLFWLGGCATLQLPVETSDSALRARAVSDTVKEVTLSASVLSAADSEQLFGTDINSTGVQPVWIEVRNNSTHTLWLMRAGTDPSYFSPLEVAWPLHTKFAKKSNASIDAYFNAHSFQSPIPPGSTRNGILFTNPHLGTYVFNVDLIGQQTIFPFTLFLPIPGEHDADTEAALARLAESDNIDYRDSDAFRSALEQLPCCANGGDPVNMVFIGEINDIGAAVIRRGYRMQKHDSDARQRLFERPPDLVMRKSGDGAVANWLRIWVAPLRYQGKPVLLVQSGRPLGGRFDVTSSDKPQPHPNIDESRNLLVQDLLYSGGLAQLGYVGGVGVVPRTLPENTDSATRYHTDGLRAVLFFVTRPLALSDIEILDWVPVLQQRETKAAENNMKEKSDAQYTQ